MRILMLAQFYAPIIGGEERHVQDLSVELVKRGHRVSVATLAIPGTPEFEVDQGVRIHRIKSTTQRASWLYSQAERSHAPPLPDPQVFWTLRQIIDIEKPDIVHAHNWLYHSFVPLKLLGGRPLVLSLHDYSFRCTQKRLMQAGKLCSGPGLAKCIACAGDHYGGMKGRVTAITHRLANPLVRAAVDVFLPVSNATAIGNGLVEERLPYQVIPNFIPDDPSLIPEDINDYVSQLPQDGFLLFVGDVSLDKGIDVLLRAYAQLQPAPPLVLIGRKRPDTPSNLPENVLMMGSWPHAAVMEAYRRSSVSLLPSICPETFGIVVIEAMSMGRPVIASRIAGLADVIIEGESGFLVPPGDPVALRKCIQRLLDNPDLRERMGQGALRRAQDFRASAVVSQIEAVYLNLIQTTAGVKGIGEASEIGENKNVSKCPHCQSTIRQNKAGKTSAGSQRYRCMYCRRKYTPVPKGRGHAASIGNQPAKAQEKEAKLGRISRHLKTAARRVTEVSEALPKVELPFIKKRAILIVESAHAAIKRGGARCLAVVSSVAANTRFFSKISESARTSQRWGWLPEISVIQSIGLLLIAWAFTGARAASTWAIPLLWLGLAIMILPVAFRLASVEVARRERIALVVLLGMALYLVKVMHSPVDLTFPDELSHVRNVQEILENQRLFVENPVQPVTALYPGLPTITSTLVSLSGMSIFSAGILVIGAARLILFLALYLLYEQVSGSPRVAGLAVLLYMANPNFLYWTAEYAYEPLALPMVILVLFLVARRGMSNVGPHPAVWTVAALLSMIAVVLTHHMSSYILTGLLGTITVISIFISRGRQRGPWDLALASLFVISMWLIFVANLTINYLSPVLGGAIESILGLIAEEETSRELFSSSSTGYQAPLWEQWVAIASVVVIVLGMPLGVWEVWRRHRKKVFALLLAAIALAYLPVQMLRFTSAGWETANRSSEFLFLGIGFTLALGIVKFWLMKWTGRGSKLLFAGLAVALFFGGLIAGWPPKARLPRPYVISAQNHLVKPQVVSVAEWMAEVIGPDSRVATSKAGAKMLGAYGQHPFTGGTIKDMFFTENVGAAERHTLMKRDIQYVLLDRKMIGWDHMIGYYFFNSESSLGWELELVEPKIYEKFDGLEGVTRVLDSGDMVLYEVEPYLEGFKDPGETTGRKTTLAVIPPPFPGTAPDLPASGDAVEPLNCLKRQTFVSRPVIGQEIGQ